MSDLPECCAGEGYPGIAHDLLTARTERDRLRRALDMALEWIELRCDINEFPLTHSGIVRALEEEAKQ